jgi:23S rRNA pseudouridine2604 synthase
LKAEKEELLRLSKLMSERGICSRREADSLIERKLVKVNGELATLGLKVKRSDKILVLNQAQSLLDNKVTIALHKPRGYVSSQPEKNYEHALSLVKKKNYFGEHYKDFNPKGLAPLGRLDIDSTGLILYSQKGSLAKKIIGSNSLVEKEYEVNVTDGELSDAVLSKLSFGLSLDGEKLKRAKVKKISPTFFKITLIQGKKRQIRRMCELVGLKVTRLKRIRIGKLKLNDLPEGSWTFVNDFDLL